MERITFWKNGKLVTKKIRVESMLVFSDVKRYAAKRGITEFYWCGMYYLNI